MRPPEPPLMRWARHALLTPKIGLGAFGISRISFNVDPLALLPPDLPGVAGTSLLQQVFERPDEMLVTLRASDDTDLAEAAASFAAALSETPGLVRQVRFRPPWEAHPEALVELVAYAWWNAPQATVAALRDALADDRLEGGINERIIRLTTTLDPLETALVANDLLGLTDSLRAGADPAAMDSFADGGLENAAGTFRVLRVEAPAPLAGYREAQQWLDRLAAAAARWRAADPAHASVRIRFTGQPAFQAEIGNGMEHDMTQSVSGITFVVAFLFWLLHRRLRPLLQLMAAMLGSGLITLGLAGVLFGSLNVMSMGFAAILMGMIEDFGVLGLNEAMEHPDAGFAAIHRRVAVPVWWSALTSAAVFGVLGLSSLPGISQMGILTAMGILVGAAVMLYGFLPLAMRRRCPPPPAKMFDRLAARPATVRRIAIGLAVVAVAVLAILGLPGVVAGTAVLRPRHCEAFAALEEYQREMLPDHEHVAWLPVIARAPDPQELGRVLQRADAALTRPAAAPTPGLLSHYLPVALVPDPPRQQANAALLAALAADRERIFRTADRAGVTADGLALATAVFDRWQSWGRDPRPLRQPDLQQMEDTLGRQLHVAGDSWTACGYLRIDKSRSAEVAPLLRRLDALPGIELAGWEYLGDHLANLLGGESRRVLLPALLVLGTLLPVVFRGWRERLVVVVSLGCSGLLLLAAMSVLGIGWNFVNIGTIPLCLGLGLDFHIHMIHALRHAERSGEHTRAVSRALAYCGLSTGLGFGALALADNAGLASFGICATVGVLGTLACAAFLVPALWQLKAGATGTD